ncbi:hypothetical protein H5410_057747 [Solanum commersonii]|uniref:Uncharacterized protein n=1 Tax=Solanum commersonii TaxID=4109 RepID=A0A9J5WQM2_SOLCO|nr:hypothetical protein H5410_057747 [Solanum commersonii]
MSHGVNLDTPHRAISVSSGPLKCHIKVADPGRPFLSEPILAKESTCFSQSGVSARGRKFDSNWHQTHQSEIHTGKKRVKKSIQICNAITTTTTAITSQFKASKAYLYPSAYPLQPTPQDLLTGRQPPLHISKPFQSRFPQLVHHRGHSHPLPNNLVPNLIAPSVPTHSSQHPHLRNMHFLDMCGLDWPTLRSIQQGRCLPEGFKEGVEGWWKSFEISGRLGFILAGKLKLLKSKLKEWNIA